MQIFRRILLTFFLVALSVMAIIALVYAVYDWQGRRAWNAAQHAVQAKGESLEWSHFVPPPVPDDQNLAMAPLYARQFCYQKDPKTGNYTFGPSAKYPTDLKGMPYGGDRPDAVPHTSWDLGTRTDLAAYAKYLGKRADFPHSPQPGDPAADVLAALTRYDPALDELARAAAERPRCRFPVDWYAENPMGIRLPHDNLQQMFVSTLRLRASARLAAGQKEAAIADIDLALRLCRELAVEPTLIAYLVQITCQRIVLTPFWEGLLDRRWSAAEMAHFQRELQDFNTIAAYQHALRGERASAGIRAADYLTRHPGDLLGVFDGLSQDPAYTRETRAVFDRIGQAAPQAWFDYNKATMVTFFQDYLIEGVDSKQHRVFREKSFAAASALAAIRPGPTTMIARLLLPVFVDMSRRAAQMQTNLDEAVTAFALERFQLEHGNYPTVLSELVPVYLERVPTDPVDGAPLCYVLTPDNRYRLYGVGWNGRDDGGKVAWRASDGRLDDRQGDWVWQYEPIQRPPVK